MPSVHIKTYGCQMNVRDSEQVQRQLAERGYTLAASEQDADVILLNTCSVRDMAEQKALGRAAHLSALKQNKPNLVLGVMGCMAQRIGDDILDRLPEVDLVVGTQKFHQVADYVEELRGGKESGPPPGETARRILDTEAESGSQNTIREHVLGRGQVSAFVSIMQGCNMHCTFCIVPTTRGPERARPIAEIVAEVRRLAEQGVKEVTLLGQIVNLYGRHEFEKDARGRSPFVQLLETVCAVEGIERVRFTSPHPIGFRDDLIEAFTYLPELCEHVHLPLQSGNNRILKAMHRAYTVEKFHTLADKLRAAHPDMAITTDIIVGFPGETEAEFADTVAATRRVGFNNAFIFRYSPRTGTPAAGMEDQLSEEEKMARNRELLRVIDEINAPRTEAFVGSETTILVEGESKNNPARFQGRTRSNQLVIIEANERFRGELLPVRIVESTGFTHYAEPALVGVA